MDIASVRLEGNVFLAPMAGVTDFPFRLLCREMGCALAFTEMVSAKGMLLAPPGNRAARELLLTSPQEGPVALQLFGREPQTVAEVARRLAGDGRFCLVDLNMGCPAPKIAGSGEGSGLLREPDLAVRVAEVTSPELPPPPGPTAIVVSLGLDVVVSLAVVGAAALSPPQAGRSYCGGSPPEWTGCAAWPTWPEAARLPPPGRSARR